MKDVMKSINLKDADVLAVLDKFKNLWYNDLENFQKYMARVGHNGNEPTIFEDRNYWVGDKHKNEIINMGRAHNGFPEVLVGYTLKPIRPDEKTPPQFVLRPNDIQTEYYRQYTKLNAELQSLLGTNMNALCAVYPPGGYISWHNNANAAAYNIIMTWSENGNGYWKHVDPNTGEDVLVKDVPGWQAKSFYFGGYEDNRNDLVYHMASTDCWRMTISYVFDRHHEQYCEDTIAMLEND